MAIKETRTYAPPAGHEVVIRIDEWAETLFESDRQEFYLGRHYQLAREKAFTAMGKLSIDGNVYTWDSQESIDKCGKDAIYKKYHDRYLSETGITLTITTETV